MYVDGRRVEGKELPKYICQVSDLIEISALRTSDLIERQLLLSKTCSKVVDSLGAQAWPPINKLLSALAALAATADARCNDEHGCTLLV